MKKYHFSQKTLLETPHDVASTIEPIEAKIFNLLRPSKLKTEFTHGWIILKSHLPVRLSNKNLKQRTDSDKPIAISEEKVSFFPKNFIVDATQRGVYNRTNRSKSIQFATS